MVSFPPLILRNNLLKLWRNTLFVLLLIIKILQAHYRKNQKQKSTEEKLVSTSNPMILPPRDDHCQHLIVYAPNLISGHTSFSDIKMGSHYPCPYRLSCDTGAGSRKQSHFVHWLSQQGAGGTPAATGRERAFSSRYLWADLFSGGAVKSA